MTEDKNEEELEELEGILNEASKGAKKIDEGVKTALIGGGRKFKNVQLRPVTLSTLAILEKLGSSLMTGEEGNHVMEALIFLWVQSEKPEIVRAATLAAHLDDKANVTAKALELGEKLEISDMQELVDCVSSMMEEASQTKVEAIPTDEAKKHRAKSKNK